MNRPQSDKKRLGKWGEQFAARYLQQHGFYILAQNFHSSLGEVDIVAEDQNCLVLVEVKTRQSLNYGSPAEAVTFQKLEKIMSTGYFFAKQAERCWERMRIDVIAISFDSISQNPIVEHLIDVSLE